MLERPDAVLARYTVEGPPANTEALSEDTAITLIHAGIRYPADEHDGRIAAADGEARRSPEPMTRPQGSEGHDDADHRGAS
jgi:hypothetical protein